MGAYTIPRGYVEDPPPLQIEVTETTVSYSRTFTPAPLAEERGRSIIRRRVARRD
jgi:hypothetical protein